MSKIVIADDKSLENLDIRFDHLLLKKEELQKENETFLPIESLLNEVPDNFFPSLLISGSVQKAVNLLNGDDELELFFQIVLVKNREHELFEKLKSLKPLMNTGKYKDFLMFMFFHFEQIRDEIISEIKISDFPEKDGVVELILSVYDKEPCDINHLKGTESLYATFFEALKAEQSNDFNRAFTLMLTLFEKTDFHSFIFEMLKFYMVRYNGISPDLIEQFFGKVTESGLTVSYSNLKFIEFIYYYKNDYHEKIENVVVSLAESTDSLFILNVIAPLLYKYQKWHLVGKYYKLCAKKTTGAERTKYLELLADIYENKLNMPEFATEIHKNIVEEDAVNCSISLSKVLFVYEENSMWEELSNLYNHLAGREEDVTMKAYYYYKCGDVLHNGSGKISQAREFLEKSLSLKFSFEVVRTLSEIYLKMHDYDAYIKTLVKELEFSTEINEKIRVMNIIADTYMTHKKDYESSQKYLIKILEISPNHLPTVKKLGKIYYLTKNWKKLTEINFLEIDLTKDLVDIVNLYYRNGSIFFKELADIERSYECFMEILEIEPDHIPSMLYLEKIYVRKKDTENLIILYKRILEASQGDSETRQYYLTRLGIIYRDINLIDQSYEIFETLLKMFPENIMAKENLRMIKGLPDFNDSIVGNSIENDIGLLSDLVRSDNHESIADHFLKKAEPSLWKHFYFLSKNNDPSFKPEEFDNDELFISEILERNFSIDTLVKQSSKKIALMLLVEKYIDEQYFRGIYTILKYYLSFEPENKRKIWSIFFRGLDNPEIKEELENILLSNSKNESLDIVREVLEKIYLSEKDYNTVLFLRNIFIKKIENKSEKCSFIDSTINLLSENIGTEQLFELYKQRYESTPEDELNSYQPVYEKYLKSIFKNELLSSLYESEWKKNPTLETGKKRLDHYLSLNDFEKAVIISKDILKIHKNNEIFLKSIELLRKTGNINLAINDVANYIENSDVEMREQLQKLLLDLNIEAGYTQNAIDLFNKAQHSDLSEKFYQGIKLAELMSINSIDENTVSLVRSLIATNRQQKKEKLSFIFKSGHKLANNDLDEFESFKELNDCLEGNIPDKFKYFILSFFSVKGDVDAKKILVSSYIKSGDEENALREFNTMNSDNVQKAILLSKIAWKKEDFDKEKNLLRDVLFESMAKGETYPAKRLIILEKDNRRVVFFLKSFLNALNIDENIEEELYPRIFAVEKNKILDFAGFNETDSLIQEYLQIIFFGSRDETKIQGRPLNSKFHRNLINLIEYIKISTDFDNLSAVFNEKQQLPFEVVDNKLPCISFGEESLKMNPSELKFHVIKSTFLLSCGIKTLENEKEREILIEKILSSLKLEGKEKVRFIKNVKPNLQNRLLEIHNKLQMLEENMISGFFDRIIMASCYHTFSLVPDISIALSSQNCSLENITQSDCKFSKTIEFINNFFFQKG